MKNRIANLAKFLMSYLMTYGLVIYTGGTEAQAQAETLNCKLDCSVDGSGFQFILGEIKFTGYCDVRCSDQSGNAFSKTADITIGGVPCAPFFGLGVAFPLHLISDDFILKRGLDELAGNYTVFVGQLPYVFWTANGVFFAENLIKDVYFKLNVVAGEGLSFGLFGFTSLRLGLPK